MAIFRGFNQVDGEINVLSFPPAGNLQAVKICIFQGEFNWRKGNTKKNNPKPSRFGDLTPSQNHASHVKNGCISKSYLSKYNAIFHWTMIMGERVDVQATYLRFA